MKTYGRLGIAIAFCITSIFAIFIYFFLIRAEIEPTASSSSKTSRKLIIDTDAGADDAGAILLALAAEKRAKKNCFEVVAITCVYGNKNLTSVESNVMKILTVANRSDIPVYSGARKPLVKNHAEYTGYADDGLDGFELEGETVGEIDRSRHASLRLIDLAREHKGTISVVALGPLTNVALAIILDPGFVYNVERFYVTGSRIHRVNNNQAVAEFNFRQDPHSSFVVFNFARDPVVSLPWETVLSTEISKKWRLDVLGMTNSTVVKFLNEVETESPDEPTWRAADMMMTASILWPELVTRTRLTNLSPVYDETSRGSVSVERTDGSEKIENALIIEAFDVEGFKKVLLDTLS